jgi:hypothetical protein
VLASLDPIADADESPEKDASGREKDSRKPSLERRKAKRSTIAISALDLSKISVEEEEEELEKKNSLRRLALGVVDGKRFVFGTCVFVHFMVLTR